MKTIYVKDIGRKLKKSISGGGKEFVLKKAVPTAVFLTAMFFLGRAAAELYGGAAGNREEAKLYGEASENPEELELYREEAGGAGQSESGLSADGKETGLTEGVSQGTDDAAGDSVLIGKEENWGLGFGKKAGEKPTGNASVAEMAKYNAYYMAEGDEKVLYLTFDCGYENGNTEAILDALKKHNAPATFFVVGHFLETAPEIAKRMVEDGHTVGNHTYHHYDMSKISDKASFEKEMKDVEDLFREATGVELSMYYRPPQGKYSTNNLQMAKDLGYSTFFWSLAYVDWNVDDQPSHETAFEKLTTRVHPGAIVLLHSTSKTNGEILDELLTKWEDMGYSFKPLSDFVENADGGNGAGSLNGNNAGKSGTNGSGTGESGESVDPSSLERLQEQDGVNRT